jgi:hypothetical protein
MAAEDPERASRWCATRGMPDPPDHHQTPAVAGRVTVHRGTHLLTHTPRTTTDTLTRRRASNH